MCLCVRPCVLLSITMCSTPCVCINALSMSRIVIISLKTIYQAYATCFSKCYVHGVCLTSFRHVMSLPDIQWLLSGRGGNVDGNAVIWKQLLKAIGSRFQSSQAWHAFPCFDSPVGHVMCSGSIICATLRHLSPRHFLLHSILLLSSYSFVCLSAPLCPLPHSVRLSLCFPSLPLCLSVCLP